MIVWFVGNCHAQNGRNEYVKRLQRFIHVDIYGNCGTLKCSRRKQKECRSMMGRVYKFVVAFENSLCWDYVTEKFFYNLNFDIIPIILDYHGNLKKFAPPRSYINALDFPTVKDLANYLKLVDKNDTLYNEYFLWKRHFAFEFYSYEPNTFGATARGYCSLCSKLHQPSLPSKVYRNLTKWWHYGATCKVLKFFHSSPDDEWFVENYDPPTYSK